MQTQKIGWIGLGNMGIPIIKNLLKARFAVTVYNRTKGKEQELTEAGATVAAHPQDLIEKCDIIVTMVSDDTAVKSIYEGRAGLVSAKSKDKLLIDMSTVSPETSKYLAKIAKEAGHRFVEAPVSGSVKQATDAALIILAGGHAEDVEAAAPFFNAIGKKTVHLGDNGKGSTAKLAINYFLALTTQGLAETVLFATSNGIDKEAMLTIINESAVASPFVKIKSGLIQADKYQPAFALKLMAKDLRLVKEQIPALPLSAPLIDTFQQAQAAGLGDQDLMAVITYLEQSTVDL